MKKQYSKHSSFRCHYESPHTASRKKNNVEYVNDLDFSISERQQFKQLQTALATYGYLLKRNDTDHDHFGYSITGGQLHLSNITLGLAEILLKQVGKML